MKRGSEYIVSTRKKVKSLKGFSTISYKPKVFKLPQNWTQNNARLIKIFKKKDERIKSSAFKVMCRSDLWQKMNQ